MDLAVAIDAATFQPELFDESQLTGRLLFAEPDLGCLSQA